MFHLIEKAQKRFLSIEYKRTQAIIYIFDFIKVKNSKLSGFNRFLR